MKKLLKVGIVAAICLTVFGGSGALQSCAQEAIRVVNDSGIMEYGNQLIEGGKQVIDKGIESATKEDPYKKLIDETLKSDAVYGTELTKLASALSESTPYTLVVMFDDGSLYCLGRLITTDRCGYCPGINDWVNGAEDTLQAFPSYDKLHLTEGASFTVEPYDEFQLPDTDFYMMWSNDELFSINRLMYDGKCIGLLLIER